MYPTLLAPVPEDSVFVDHGEGWTDAYVEVEIHCTELTAITCQSSCAALQSILSKPNTLASWMRSIPNQHMLQTYQQAVQLCYDSGHSFVEASGTLYITTQSCDMTATCIFNIGLKSDTFTEDDDFEDQSFEPEVRVILTDFAPVKSKKTMNDDSIKLVMKGVGTPSCSVKNHLGNVDFNSQSQAGLAKRHILKL